MTIIAQAIDQPVITTYDTLQSDVASWLHRTDLGAQIPRFIALAEARIKALLWARQQDTVTVLPTVAGVAYVQLPADFLRVRALSIPDVVPQLSYVPPLDYQRDNYAGTSNAPHTYTIIGDRMYLGPKPDAAYGIEFAYQAFFRALSDVNQSNALLAKWPNLYLWATCAEGAKFCRDLESFQAFEASFGAALDAINQSEWNAPGALTVRADSKVC